MLDFVYYPVSAVLLAWHTVFGSVFGPDNGITWALAVLFLVFTIRLLLLRPTMRQMRTQRKMTQLQPEIAALRKRYAGDRNRQAVELQKLQKEHGVNPLLGCLPLLVQAPVFLGLLHVLLSFNRTGTGWGKLGMSPELNAHTANYLFSASDVQSFLGARLFGVPISAAITSPSTTLEAFAGFGSVPSALGIAAVAAPLMLAAALFTHLNARHSVSRQTTEAEASPQAVLLNRLALWVFPIGAVIGGPFLMIAVLVYWVGNNLWTYLQQRLVYSYFDRETSTTV